LRIIKIIPYRKTVVLPKDISCYHLSNVKMDFKNFRQLKNINQKKFKGGNNYETFNIQIDHCDIFCNDSD